MSPQIFVKRYGKRQPLEWEDYAKADMFSLAVCAWLLLCNLQAPMKFQKVDIGRDTYFVYDYTTRKPRNEWSRPDVPDWLVGLLYKMLYTLVNVKDVIGLVQ